MSIDARILVTGAKFLHNATTRLRSRAAKSVAGFVEVIESRDALTPLFNACNPGQSDV